MGYTHYFSQEKQIEPSKWEAYCQDVRKFLHHVVAEKGVQLQSDCDENPSAFEVTPERVQFNGDSSRNLDHETFSLSKTKTYLTSGFCKTARKPYDIAVCGCLILAHRHFPGAYCIGSDGYVQDWQNALDCVQDLFQDLFEIPPRVPSR